MCPFENKIKEEKHCHLAELTRPQGDNIFLEVCPWLTQPQPTSVVTEKTEVNGQLNEFSWI